MDSREIPNPPPPPPPSLQQQQQPPPGITMSHYRNPNMIVGGPTSTSPPPQYRSPFGTPPSLQQQIDHQKTMTMETLGLSDGSSPSSQQVRFGIDQSQNVQQQVQKKKRGRPRKYNNADGNIALGLGSGSPLLSAASNSYGGDGESGGNVNSVDPPAKRNRGRPPGSSKKQQLETLGTAGVGFTPHVIEVKQGEDVALKVMAFTDQGPRTICILSATGTVSSVGLHQPANPNGTVTYEGRFEIITCSGSFTNYEVNGEANRTGCMSVALAGTDGRILGGSVFGPLIAATPVQVILGSFVADPKKQKQNSVGNNVRGPNPPEPVSAPANNLLNFSNSQGQSSESSEDNNESGSPPSMHHDNSNNNNNGIYGNNVAQHQMHQMHLYHQLWSSHGHGHGHGHGQ